LEVDIFPIEIDDVCTRLRELKACNSVLSQRMEHEEGIPDDAVPFLIERIETASVRCASATTPDRADAVDELMLWLVKSYQFYLTRLFTSSGETPWRFRFAAIESHSQH